MVRNLSFQFNGLCSLWGTEHTRRVRCYQQGKCTFSNPGLSIFEANRRQVVASGYNQQKAGTVKKVGKRLQSPAGWSPAKWLLLGSILFPMQATTRVILMDFHSSWLYRHLCPYQLPSWEALSSYTVTHVPSHPFWEELSSCCRMGRLARGWTISDFGSN